MGLATVLANVQLAKNVDLLGMDATLGNVLFASTFLATDILSECYGEKHAKKGVFVGLFSVIIYLVISQITLLYAPNELDITHEAMKTLFGLTPRICISSIVMYFLANWMDVILYNKLLKKFGEKKMWMRNNVTTIICNGLENFGLMFLIFAGTMPIMSIIQIAVASSVIEIFIALCDTPYLYLAKKIK